MRYDHKKIEKKWQKKWLHEKIYEPDLRRAKKPFYNLMMFPYPSAEGLHVGNMYAFTGSDIYGRFKRMSGFDVFEPIGLDGFGIHSENYALKIGEHPMKLAEKTEKNFYRQLQMLGNGFAWENRLETYDPEYYKWTQWIFVQMFKNGLAYRKKAAVNWCPECLTVLADEQIISGKCERCSTEVIKKELKQWFFKITSYADKLLNNLEKIDWTEKIKITQRNWIGKSKGAEIEFIIANFSAQEESASDGKIKIFTTRPDTIFGVTYLVLAPEHPLLNDLINKIKNPSQVRDYIKISKAKTDEDRLRVEKDKTGVELKGIKAVNPANQEKIPIFVADYVLVSYGTGAIMGVPAHDERDFEFAKKNKLPIVPVIESTSGKLINSGKFTGLGSEETKDQITDFVGGKVSIRFRLHDWLISRQRYWGPPIPMIFCDKCARLSGSEDGGWHPVLEKELPVILPYIKEFRPTGSDASPLASHPSFYKTTCPECGGEARRETDVSDTFLDSSWYYIRYLNYENKAKIIDKVEERKWLPVHMYIGGAEHAVLHLLYTRFIAMALRDWGYISFEEPFTKFRAHGLLIREGTKMSKSKGNVVNPDEYIEKYGADVLRMYLMFLAPLEQGGDFYDRGIAGIIRFLEKIWKNFSQNKKSKEDAHDSKEILKILNKTIDKVSNDIENLRYNTAISALMELFSKIQDDFQNVSQDSKENFLKLLSPFAPHLTEEIWREILGKKNSIHGEKNWPKVDKKYLEEDNFELIIQINGKLKDVIKAKMNIKKNEAEALVLDNSKIKQSLQGKTPKKIIFIPNRLINIVI